MTSLKHESRYGTPSATPGDDRHDQFPHAVVIPRLYGPTEPALAMTSKSDDFTKMK